MALVAYDYDSGSDNEIEEDEASTSSAVIIRSTVSNVDTGDTKKPEANPNMGNDFDEEESSSKIPEILSHLPETKHSNDTVNELDDKLEDFIPKYQPELATEKKPQKVKITIPKLSDFEDVDDEPEQKRRKAPSKGSGLLSMLPPVRGSPLSTTSFVPKVLKNKPPADKKTNSLVPQAVRKRAEEAKMATIKKISGLAKKDGSDAESDDDIEIPETFDDEMWQKVCGPKSRPKPQIIEEDNTAIIPEINIAPEPAKPYDGLDNAAFKELVGKAKRPVNIKLIDINEEEIVADKDVWLTKSLTDPEQAPKKVVENPVDPTRKKKHHITYLAEQAKANEQELQSQWSSNKYARNQTRAKYGF